MRAFIAIDVKDSTTLQGFSALQGETLACGMDVKPVEVENIHITMKFLGEIGEDMAEAVISRIKEVSYPSIDASYVGLGAFPTLNRPSVIWVGLDEDSSEKVKELAGYVDRSISMLGFRAERDFHGHVTICRVRSGRSKERLKELYEKYKGHVFGSERIVSIKLKRSDLTPRGPIYTEVFETRLRE